MNKPEHVNYYASSWEIYGPGFDNKRKARILAGRLWFFVRGTKVTKRADGLYYVWIWNDER